MAQASDVQRLFLQAILSRGVLSESLAQVLWKKCVEAVKGVISLPLNPAHFHQLLRVQTAADENIEVPYSNTEEAWDEFIQGVNTSLNDLDFEFKSIQDEFDGKRLFAMVNRKDDELAQVATDYNAIEIMYFKAIVEQIMLARNESFSVSSLAALREVSAGKEKINLTKAQADILLDSFVANGWLLRSKRGRYSLSSRSLLELLPYIKSTYPEETIECTICHEIITKGIACERDNCKTRMHYHCFTTYRKRKSTCPACSLDWPQKATDDGLLPVGELAIRDGDDGRRQTRDSPDSDDDEEMEDEPSHTQTKSRPPRRSQTRKKANSKKMHDDSEEEAEDKNETDEEETEDTSPPRRRSNR
ncbi:Nse1 non-SMC component of SMC5-6 complex-domain-containing protein [Lentinula aciculospora]|uniref:Non-structural maintenance of chromosomes element 1 homolog n=1 Tax=Lentinula aciculospora TaxID=153920 RepID=A0A9W9AQD6_9AGAR|nr:Nse1 non-SMC component of SMC5-6 complex-domain-containing protein [Lentinula aciculospora]